ncbi:Type 1 glutamine amidotransferase-like domain-containing protein [Candidatus Kuenenbacteria bacterium]|nr:Type 1 glutamine amidotransferase-like domain-containing protein [Candidatus Kuenenbacteria bacterium]
MKYGYNLTGIPKDQMKIGYITTALKGTKTDFNQKLKSTIRGEGYPIDEIDIEEKNKEELKNFFKDKNIIYIEGGNTFYLLKAIKETGFDKILKELLSEGKIYIGVSAGAYIMRPTIEVSNWKDKTTDRWSVTDFSALNYVSFVLKVHYTDEQEIEVKEKMKNLKFPLRVLRDGQGILVENDKNIFCGDGKEVILS